MDSSSDSQTEQNFPAGDHNYPAQDAIELQPDPEEPQPLEVTSQDSTHGFQDLIEYINENEEHEYLEAGGPESLDIEVERQPIQIRVAGVEEDVDEEGLFNSGHWGQEQQESSDDQGQESNQADDSGIAEGGDEELQQNEDSEPPSKKLKIADESDDEDGTTCSICFDAWSNVGEHRLVSLKCGHLFGLICIRKWFRSQRTYEKSCPTCKRRSNIKDFRFIYARKLVAMDVTELQACRKQLAIAKEEKTRIEEELQKTLVNQKYYLKQIDELRVTIKEISNRNGTVVDRNFMVKGRNPNKQIKVMFRTKDHITMDPTAIFRRMQRYNPSLKIENWKIVHRRIEEGGQRLIIYIDRQSGEAIKKAGYGAYTGVDRGFFRFLNE